MTSENAEKTFTVTPSEYLKNFISDKIKNQYIKSQIHNALTIGAPSNTSPPPPPNISEEEMEETLCPTCKNKLIFAEGCNLCIDCGYSGCTSG